MSQRRPPDQDRSAQQGRPASASFVGADPRLLACRDIALQLLVQSFDGFFNRLEDEFLGLADKSFDRNLRDTYFAARAETKSKRDLIKTEFRQHFINAFNARIFEYGGDQRNAHSIKMEMPIEGLSLVANEEYDENLTANDIANTFKTKSGEDLRQMQLRMARLIPHGDEKENESPISPEVICEAMMGACKQLESGEDSRLVALRAFEQQLTNQVAEIYRQVNEFLVQQNVLPVVYKTRSRNGNPGEPSKGSAEQGRNESALSNTSDNHGDTPGMVQVSIPTTLAAHLEYLLNGQLPADASPHQKSAEISFLNQLQHRLPSGSVVLEGTGMHPARDNLVSLLQNTQWASSLQQMDSMTLNLVALLFDRLFEDSRLPDAIKGLIGRLQIPILKVALLDSSFFARKNHPARQLLDRLAETAIDWQGDADAGNPRFDKFSSIVSWVVTNYEDDVGIFVQALNDLDDFLLAESDAAACQVQEDTDELAASELHELGIATADGVIKGRMFKRDVPPLISDFVQQWWTPALAKAYGPAGEDEPRFINYVATLDDLLWSVEPKRSAEERLKLVNCLPGMLKTLEDGADLALMPLDKRNAFMSELVHCHAAAIRNGMRPQPAAQPTQQQVAHLQQVRHAIAVAEQVAAPVAPEVPVLSDIQAEPVSEMPKPFADDLPKRWEWVELNKADGSVIKLRLTWVSPQGTRFLFTNRNGANGHTFNQAEIKRMLQSGQMRREALSGSLTDDVFDQLRDTLKH